MARAHRMAAAVEQQSRQERLPLSSRVPPLNGILVEERLHGLEHRSLDQGWLLAFVDLSLVGDLADVEAVAQDVGQRPSPDRGVADAAPVSSPAQGRADAALGHLSLQS